MMRFIIIALIIGVSSCKGDANRFVVCSPDTGISLQIIVGEQGGLSYQIICNKQVLVPPSELGVQSIDSAYTFIDKLTFIDVSTTSVDETYSLPTGKRRQYRNRYREKRFRFGNAQGNIVQIDCRAYNDGVAFRYRIEKDGEIGIVAEQTRFALPQNAQTWMMDYLPDYENYFLKRTFADVGKQPLCYPALFEIDGRWLLLTEAGVFNHPATAVQKTTNGQLQTLLPEKQFTVDNRYESPWRTFLIGDNLGVIVESTLTENLNPPSVIKNTEWIEPGVAVFPWWGNYLANSYIDTLKAYVDLAAAMKWNWIEFDISLVGSPFRTSKEWETTAWLKDFTDYARSRGVNVYGWDEIGELDTKAKRNHVYGKYRELGVKGIKIDYINSDRLYAMQFRDSAMLDAANYGLLVSFHGETAPRGQRRKYPNLMTCEGVKGSEYYTLRGTQCPNSTHNCTLPFTRNVVGSMDYTPVTFTVRQENPRTTTYAHELALPFIFESGWTVMADRPQAYLQSPARDLLTKIRATWDETIFIDGYPSEFICMARRHGTAWYLAAINAETEREVHIKLNFLPQGSHTFKVYEDHCEDPLHNINIREVSASNTDELSVKLPPNGGFCTVIE
ncbi:MAG: glycoside hydrolase family 97 protein [Prevotellaceae bacterium]|jgi:alpha-glucosidase|nr:glycoside hydrolase family 97 protein [Prevotellaceae bacterium]